MPAATAKLAINAHARAYTPRRRASAAALRHNGKATRTVAPPASTPAMKEKNNAIGSTDKYRRGDKYCRLLAPQQRVSMCRPACLHVPTKKSGKTCIYTRFRSDVR